MARRETPGHPVLGRAGLVFAIAGGTLFEHLTHVDAGIDNSTFRELPGPKATSAPVGVGATAFFTLG